MSDPFTGKRARRTIEVIESPFAARMRDARKELGWTQEYAAQQINVNRTQMTNYEAGNSTPTIRGLVRICEAYNVSADWLLWGE